MAELPDQYVPPMLYYPINYYSWVNEWEWTDTSRKLRGGIFSGFRFGTQLWDENVNNTLEWIGWWAPRWSHYRRDLEPFKAPPWYRVGVYIDVLDPKHCDPPEGWENIVKYSTDFFTYPLMPEPGFETYVYADRMVVTFTGSEWKPKFRLPELEKTFEIQIFANYPVKGQVMATHVVSQPFKIYANSSDSRLRGWQNTWAPIPILKNGEQVGYLWKSTYSSGATMEGDVTFLPGDIFQVVCPRPGGTPIGVSISLVGEAL